MKIKQTIKKIEEGCGKDTEFYHGLLPEEKVYWKCGEYMTKERIYCPKCETTLSGYKLALEDVLSEIDDWFNKKKVLLRGSIPTMISKHGFSLKDLEELKKPIQEILKDRIEVLK